MSSAISAGGGGRPGGGGGARGAAPPRGGAPGEDRSGGDGVDSDSGRAELGRPGASHRRQRGLGGAVGGGAREADLSGHARNVDDAAATPLGHLRGQHGYEEVGSANIGREKAVEGLDVEFGGRSEPGESGVVH